MQKRFDIGQRLLSPTQATGENIGVSLRTGHDVRGLADGRLTEAVRLAHDLVAYLVTRLATLTLYHVDLVPLDEFAVGGCPDQPMLEVKLRTAFP